MNGNPCCPLCSPAGMAFGPSRQISSAIQRQGWAVQGVVTDNPYDIGFAYTVGLADSGRPELIAFGQDTHVLSRLLNDVAVKSSSRLEWSKRFQLAAQPGLRVQLRPALDQWRDTYALCAIEHWKERPFSLWQVRLPRRDGTFSWDGFCCTPPCQPLLDKEEPWLPVEHVVAGDVGTDNNVDVLWHRVVDPPGRWDGRWEKLHGLWLAPGTYSLLNVPFLADDLALGDVVTARRDESGRDVIQDVLARSAYSTVRVDGRRSELTETIRAALDRLSDNEDVIFECSHWQVPHWTIGVPVHDLAKLEELLRPLRREGLVEYTIVQR